MGEDCRRGVGGREGGRFGAATDEVCSASKGKQPGMRPPPPQLPLLKTEILYSLSKQIVQWTFRPKRASFEVFPSNQLIIAVDFAQLGYMWNGAEFTAIQCCSSCLYPARLLVTCDPTCKQVETPDLVEP